MYESMNKKVVFIDFHQKINFSQYLYLHIHPTNGCLSHNVSSRLIKYESVSLCVCGKSTQIHPKWRFQSLNEILWSFPTISTHDRFPRSQTGATFLSEVEIVGHASSKHLFHSQNDCVDYNKNPHQE